MCFFNVHILGKVLVFLHGSSRIFHIPLDDGHMITVKTIGAGRAARWLCRFMLMPPNAEDEKNRGMEVEVAVFWTPKWCLFLVKTAGSRCSWREACFVRGDVYRHSLPTPSNYGNQWWIWTLQQWLHKGKSWVLSDIIQSQMVYWSFWEAKAKEVSEMSKKLILACVLLLGLSLLVSWAGGSSRMV